MQRYCDSIFYFFLFHIHVWYFCTGGTGHSYGDDAEDDDDEEGESSEEEEEDEEDESTGDEEEDTPQSDSKLNKTEKSDKTGNS